MAPLGQAQTRGEAPSPHPLPASGARGGNGVRPLRAPAPPGAQQVDRYPICDRRAPRAPIGQNALMTTLATASHPASTAPAGFIEKAPLERYVPPARPSLVGLSRAEL